MLLGLVEHYGGELDDLSLQMLTLAHDLAIELDLPLEAILIGEDARALVDSLRPYGVSKVHLVQHDRLDDYASDAWAQSIIHLVESVGPEAVVAAGTDRGNEVLARVAARIDLPMAANCAEVHPGDPYLVTRLRWGGSLLEEAHLSGEPKLFTVAPHVIRVAEATLRVEPTVNVVTPSLDDKDFRVRVTDRVESAGEGISLEAARVVIGGGRGVGSAEAFETLEELADLLGGTVGATRAVTNLGWRPHADQIGQTGTRIVPDFYIACGISGAVQHMVGCMGSKRILAINTDPEAPIVSKADYAVIGDLHEVVPVLNAMIRGIKGS
jgi:electron transfer flavoprotein alpha subunit